MVIIFFLCILLQMMKMGKHCITEGFVIWNRRRKQRSGVCSGSVIDHYFSLAHINDCSIPINSSSDLSVKVRMTKWQVHFSQLLDQEQIVYYPLRPWDSFAPNVFLLCGSLNILFSSPSGSIFNTCTMYVFDKYLYCM